MARQLINTGIAVVLLSFITAFTSHNKISFLPPPPADFQELLPSNCNIDNKAFQTGEEITYKIYYNWNFVWLSAGEVTFRVDDEGGAYHLNAKGKTYSSYEWFYKVRDNYDTYLDKKTLLPTVSIRDVQEGGYRLYDKVTFDQDGKKASSLRGRSKEKAERKDFLVKDCMHDILSAIYFTRNLDFERFQKGQKFPVKIFLDQEVYPLQVKYVGKETKNIKDNGKFNTIRFSPQVISGEVFKEGSEMNIWASDDANRIPLMIESPVVVGSVKAVLKSYKNLRYDMTSKVK